MKKILLMLVVGIIMSFNIHKNEGTGIAIIIHKDNPVASLTAAEVKLYWLRKTKKRWPEINKNIKPVDFKNKNGAQDAFYGTVLKMSGSDVDTYFIQKSYESAEKVQDKVVSDHDMVNFVANEPGAIGYVDAASLSAEDKAKVKVVLLIN